ncbi:Protein kinase domain-containing protein [Entamoeba marina]
MTDTTKTSLKIKYGGKIAKVLEPRNVKVSQPYEIELTMSLIGEALNDYECVVSGFSLQPTNNKPYKMYFTQTKFELPKQNAIKELNFIKQYYTDKKQQELEELSKESLNNKTDSKEDNTSIKEKKGQIKSIEEIKKEIEKNSQEEIREIDNAIMHLEKHIIQDYKIVKKNYFNNTKTKLLKEYGMKLNNLPTDFHTKKQLFLDYIQEFEKSLETNTEFMTKKQIYLNEGVALIKTKLNDLKENDDRKDRIFEKIQKDLKKYYSELIDLNDEISFTCNEVKFKFIFEVFKPSTTTDMILYFNFYPKHHLSTNEFLQKQLLIRCISSSVIDKSILIPSTTSCVNCLNKSVVTFPPNKAFVTTSLPKDKALIYEDKLINKFQKTLCSNDSKNSKNYFLDFYGKVCFDNQVQFLFDSNGLTLTQFFSGLQKPLNFFSVLSFTLDIANAISFLHDNNIVHGYLSFDSIIVENLSDNGRICKLYDLLGVTFIGDTTTRIQPFEPTIFTDPEAKKSNEFTPSMDVYSIGLIMLNLLHHSKSNDKKLFQQFLSTLSSTDESLENFKTIIQEQNYRCPQKFITNAFECLNPPTKRIHLNSNTPDSLITYLHKRKLKFLL